MTEQAFRGQTRLIQTKKGLNSDRKGELLPRLSLGRPSSGIWTFLDNYKQRQAHAQCHIIPRRWRIRGDGCPLTKPDVRRTLWVCV